MILRIRSLALCLLASACAAPQALRDDPARAWQAPPPRPAPALAPQRSKPVEIRFDVAVEDMAPADFFTGLVVDTPYSVAFAQDLGRSAQRVTLNLKGVTVEEVFSVVRDVYGLSIRRVGQTYYVGAASLETLTYRVDYLSLKRSGLSRTRVTSGQITNSPEQGNSGGGSEDGLSAAAGTEIQTESLSSFWRELELSLNVLVEPELGERVVVSPESGIAVVRAFPDRQRAVQEFLTMAHQNLHEQVIIEAKILEVGLNDDFQLGVNWGALRTHNGSTQFAGVAGGNNSFSNGSSDFNNTPLTIGPGNPITSFASTAAGGALFLALDFKDFNGVLEFLQSQGDVRMLSSPRIATLNNQKAVIKVGTDEFFVTGIENNTTTGNNPVSNTDIELTPFFSGVALDVTPRVFGNGEEIVLHVHPSVSEVMDSTKEIIVQDQVQRLPLAVSNLREADSVIRARSGQIVVIGGLIREQSSDDEFSTPILSDIPILGNLFRQKRKTTSRSELVILLRPTVVSSPSHWDNELQRIRQRLVDRVPGDWVH